MPANFPGLLQDMLTDLSTTFPEQAPKWAKWQGLAPDHVEHQFLFEYCLRVYPERFFDILYKNASVFDVNSPVPAMFLPGVDFKTLYHCEGVGEQTHQALWNYLQLILFSLVSNIQDKSMFGPEAASMFENLDETDFMDKLGDTLRNMTAFFADMEGAADTEEEEDGGEGGEADDAPKPKADPTQDKAQDKAQDKGTRPAGMSIPKIEEMYEHLRGLFDGKIGQLAKELAEEISGDMSSLLGETGPDGQAPQNTQDVLKHLMKDPSKIQQMVKTVGEKLNQKIQSGEVSHEELMKEATEILGKMKGSDGGFDIDALKEMIQRMGGKVPKNARINTNALQRMTEQQTMRERLKARMLKKKAAQAEDMLRQAQLAATQAAVKPLTAAEQAAADAALLAELGETATGRVVATGNKGGGGGGKKKKGGKR
jgi:hypothetical protein